MLSIDHYPGLEIYLSNEHKMGLMIIKDSYYLLYDRPRKLYNYAHTLNDTFYRKTDHEPNVLAALPEPMS